MENSESVKIDANTMTTSASPIQGGEGSHGEGEKGLSLPPQLEIKSGVDAVTKEDKVDQKPLVGVGHKRKASTEIDPFCESDPTSNDSQLVNSPSVSTPNVEQQTNEEMMPAQEVGDREKVGGDHSMSHGILLESDSNPDKGEGIVNSPTNVEKEKVETDAKENMNVAPEGDKGLPQGGPLGFDLNQGAEEIENSPSDVETETKVESDDGKGKMVAEPEGDKGMPEGGFSGFDLNQEAQRMVHSLSEKEKRVEPEGLSKLDLNKGEGIVDTPNDVEDETKAKLDVEEQNIEVEPYVAENIEVNPSSMEVDPSPTEKTELQPPSAVENIEEELHCVLNQEADPFSDDETEAEPNVAVQNKNEMESCGADKVEVEPSAEEEKKNEENADAVVKVKVEYSSPERYEAGPLTTRANQVQTSPVKLRGFRSPINIVIDLNELPSDEDDENQT